MTCRAELTAVNAAGFVEANDNRGGSGELSEAKAILSWHPPERWVSQGLSPYYALDDKGAPIGEGGKGLSAAFPRFADDLAWWIEAAKAQRARKAPPY
jgi:hypothetical protein